MRRSAHLRMKDATLEFVDDQIRRLPAMDERRVSLWDVYEHAQDIDLGDAHDLTGRTRISGGDQRADIGLRTSVRDDAIIWRDDAVERLQILEPIQVRFVRLDGR